MLKSCRYCGRVHQSTYDCGRKPKRIRFSSNTEAAEFRRKNIWKQTSLDIRDRDHNICQVCLAEYRQNKKSPYPIGLVPVAAHHIISIHDNSDLALERDNLITLCDYHHYQADHGEIDTDWLRTLAAGREYPPA